MYLKLVRHTQWMLKILFTIKVIDLQLCKMDRLLTNLLVFLLRGCLWIQTLKLVLIKLDVNIYCVDQQRLFDIAAIASLATI